ncbi:SDR family oxidoreductase [Rhizobium sp. 0TCS1.26]|uniref:SDR family oxidoreductase n=1 Tax=Rhizobium sp. 0TCS1.26 TaxID=3142623 RepID=UPI003D2AC823
MRVFLTGATGFIGSHIIPELLGAGHQVLGMTRSERGAAALEAAGAEPHYGDIDDLDSLHRGAAACDGIIHTAFDHDFSNYAANCARDRLAIETLGSAIEGSNRPLVITSVTGAGTVTAGEPALEDHLDVNHPNPRIVSELTVQALSERGVNVSSVRLSQIHDTVRQGLVTEMIALARRTGVSAYIGEGLNTWSAAHVSDTVRLYRLALETPSSGARYHATAESRITLRDIAASVGKRLDLPTVSIPQGEAPAHFGWLSAFVARDMSASSALTQQRLGWTPVGPGLLEDIEALESEAA